MKLNVFFFYHPFFVSVSAATLLLFSLPKCRFAESEDVKGQL